MEYREYSLTILQKDLLDNAENQLREIIAGATNCVELLVMPIEGSLRSPNGGRGICKWNSGKIKMKNTPECHQEFIDRVTQNGIFKIKRKKCN